MSESESLVCPNCSERSPAGYILCPYCGFDLTKILRQTQRIEITFRERFSRIWRSLLDPRDSKILFREVGVNPDRKGVLILLYLLSVAYATRLGAFAIKASSSTWHDFHFWYFLIQPWLTGFVFLFLSVFGWLISSLVIWLISKTLGGKASLRDTYSIVGYSLGPLITASLLVSLAIILIGPPISSITTLTWTEFTMFEAIYLPFLLIAVYHCGNGIQSGHLLNPTYSYLISGAVAGLFTYLYLLNIII
ncbi:MAG: YIP1 family protein [Candidatus Hodarchaeales archaeon]